MNHLLITHSVLRWVVLLFGLYAITKAARGLMNNQEYTKNHNLSRTLFVASIHLQLVVGIVLYFMKGWHSNISMGDSILRFWSVEHMFGMILAAVLIQIGSSKAKRAAEAKQKHKLSFRFFLIGMVIILASIPWPFREGIGRDLWPF